MPDKATFPLGASYAPFWRGLAVSKDQWEADLRNMKRLGFSYVSVFAAWHKIEKVEGTFDFSDLDHVDSLCSKIGLNFSVGVGVHRSFSLYPPRWLERAYRGEGMLDKTLSPAVSGLHVLPCFDDPWYLERAEHYLTALASHFSVSRSLAQWRVWGEASINGLCYCRHTVSKFQIWLRQKYTTVDKLNSAWCTEGPSDFNDFEEIFPPKTPSHYGGFVPWLDWQEFLDDNFADVVKWVGTTLQKSDPGRPTLVELSLPSNNTSGTANDFWKMVGGVDQFGLSIYGKNPARFSSEMDMVRSAAKSRGREPWVIEVQGAPRIFRSWGPPNSPSAARETLWLWQMIAHGAKGFFYWTYRARLSDGEGGEFGMTRRDGSIPPRLEEMSKEFVFLQKHAGRFLKCEYSADTAILWSREAEHLAAADHVDSDRINCYVHSVWGARELLLEENIPADFINPDMIRRGGLGKYKLLIMPFSFCLDSDTAKAIIEFAKNGGRVIADFMCVHKDQRGFCYQTVPGAGLDELFGAAEDEFFSAPEWQVNAEGQDFKTYEHCMTFRLRDGRALARLETGEAVAVSNNFGKGMATIIGTMAFHPNALQKKETRSFVLNLIKRAGITAPVKFELAVGAEPRQLEGILFESKPEGMLILLNHAQTQATGTVFVSTGSVKIVNLRSGATVPFTVSGGRARFDFNLDSEKSDFYILEYANE